MVSDEDSDYVDSDSEYTHTSASTHRRLRVASFFAQPAMHVGNVRHKRKAKKQCKQLVNLDDSDDDDDENVADDDTHTHHSTHTSHSIQNTHTIDNTHRRGHPPSVQQLGRNMPTRGDNTAGQDLDAPGACLEV